METKQTHDSGQEGKSTSPTALEQIQECIQDLQNKLKHIELTELSLTHGEKPDMKQESVPNTISMALEKLQMMEELSQKGQISSNPHLVNASKNMNTKENEVASAVGIDEMAAAAPHVCSIQKGSSLNEIIAPLEKERYLCVSDGFAIYCLDLKLYKDRSSLCQLPVTSTLNLLDLGLPVSMGLFKYGSDVYMVSGQEFPILQRCGLDLPSWLYNEYGFKGSSRKTHHLYLKGGELSLVGCNSFPLLKKPKFWPIVEKVGNKIHVIESMPSRDVVFEPPETIPPSHEVYDLEDLDSGWRKLLPMRYPEDQLRGMYIRDHLVVGERIFARAEPYQFLVFDSKDNKWDVMIDPRNTLAGDDMHVLNILHVKKLICVGEYKVNGELLHLVIGVSDTEIEEWPNEDTKMIAEAYLVTKTGHVRYHQELPSVFEQFNPVSYVIKSSMFEVDGEQGKTVCAIILGKVMYTPKYFVCICMFTVDLDATKLLQLDDCKDINDCKDLIKVGVKECHAYKPGPLLQEGRHGKVYPARLSACFL